MDTPIEAFLTDVLGLQGESQTEIGGCVRDYVAKNEAMFRNAKLDQRSKDIAVRGVERYVLGASSGKSRNASAVRQKLTCK
jgi:hypothetical protein